MQHEYINIHLATFSIKNLAYTHFTVRIHILQQVHVTDKSFCSCQNNFVLFLLQLKALWQSETWYINRESKQTIHFSTTIHWEFWHFWNISLQNTETQMIKGCYWQNVIGYQCYWYHTVTSLHTDRLLLENHGTLTVWALSAYLIVVYALVSMPWGPPWKKKLT